MYESEIYPNSISEKIPEDIFQEFLKTQEMIESRTLMHWSEHCTECAMPSCFKTCDLYVPRLDSKCGRFTKGIERIGGLDQNLEILKIGFKKWAVLESQGSLKLYSKKEVVKKEKLDLFLSKSIHQVPIKYAKSKLASRTYRYKKESLKTQKTDQLHFPDAFVYEIYNPNNQEVNVLLNIRNEDGKEQKMPFQYKLSIGPGYHRETIDIEQINKRLNTEKSFRIDIMPENIDAKDALYFGLKEFVKFKSSFRKKKTADKVKCVVWDLDNTLWDGILIESRLEDLKLKNGIKDILKGIEERGIINSISSKNNRDDVNQALAHFGIEEYFLFPKVNWQPKSQNIREIARDLNISTNALLFIDDSEFEREEVKQTLPELRVYDALEYNHLLDFPEMDVPVTDESKKRKQFYKEQSFRSEQMIEVGTDYLDFLRDCDIKLKISRLNSANEKRVYELSQRTNQLNFSSRRYTKEDIQSIAQDTALQTFVLECKDRFGDYGIIGFGLIDLEANELVDLMFSCRIQSKRVEHAFISFCLENYLNEKDFKVRLHRTEKNKISAQVFNDLEFKEYQKDGSISFLIFEKDRAVPKEDLISIESEL